MALTEVNSSSILDGAIKNADINASAAIAGTKISPVFGTGGDLTTHNGNRERLAILGSSSNGSMLHIRGGSPAIFFEQSGGNISKIFQDNVNLAFHAGTPASEGTNTFLLEADGDATFAGNLDVGAGLDVTGDITGTGDLTLTSTDTGSEASPIISLIRDSASPADGDYLGQLKFMGEDDGGASTVYAKITGKISDVTNTTEDGLIEFMTKRAGSNVITARLKSTVFQLQNETDLEVAGDTTLSGELTINSTRPRITLNDTDSESDFEIKNENGSFRIRDIDNPTDRYKINSSGTIHEFLGSASFSSTLNVVSNITVGGTVDGVDIAARNTLFGGLTSSSGVLTNGVTATTQSAGDNSTKVATTAYTDTAITNLIDSSPSTLNTLNELAAALGDDANFSTTVTNSIATKLPLAGGTLTGNLAINTGNSTNDLSATNIFRIMGDDVRITNAAGSEGMIFAAANGAVSLFHGMGSGTAAQAKLATTTTGVSVTGNISCTGTVDGRDLATDGSKLDGIEASATADQTASEILTLIKTVDGAGSGLDADTLDGVNSNQFLRSNVTTTYNANGNDFNFESDGSRTLIGFKYNGSLRWQLKQQSTGENLNFDRVAGSGVFQVDGNRVLTTADEGSGNGIDADTLDGQEGSYYTNASNLGSGTIPSARLSASDLLTLIKTVDGAGSGLDADLFDNINSTAFLRTTSNSTVVASDSNGYPRITHNGGSAQLGLFRSSSSVGGMYIGGDSVGFKVWTDQFSNKLTLTQAGSLSTTVQGTVWGSGNDGAGSGLDADTVDGLQASSFLRSDANDSTSGILTLTSSSQYPLVINGADNGKILLQGSSNPYIKIREGTTDKVLIQWQTNGYLRIKNHEDNSVLQIKDNLTFSTDGETTNHTIWHAGNDGAGSGLDADTLDGQQGSYYTNAANLTGTLPAIDGSNLTGISAGATGGGSDECFVETDQSVTTSYTLSSNKNAVTISPEINSGVTITVPSGATLVIL